MAKKAVVETVDEAYMAPPSPETVYQQARQAAIDVAKGLSEITELAKLTLLKSTEWAEKNNILVSVAVTSTKSAVAQRVEKAFKDYGDAHAGEISSTTWDFTSKIASAIIGEELEVAPLGTSESEFDYIDGLAIMMTQNITDHMYELNVPLFVINGAMAIAMNSIGSTPMAKGSHLEYDREGVKIPNEQEIIDSLATLYITNPAKYSEFKEFYN